jgi:hypothetical protein
MIACTSVAVDEQRFAIASGSERVQTKTRVRGFDLRAQHRVGVSERLKREYASGKSLGVR